tara:strand:- start:45029 stop:45277 length:249 start_codon:yes stop_codon:yes gene_type:complete
LIFFYFTLFIQKKNYIYPVISEISETGFYIRVFEDQEVIFKNSLQGKAPNFKANFRIICTTSHHFAAQKGLGNASYYCMIYV